VLLSATARMLETAGVQTIGVVASGPEQARLFFRFRPPRIRVGCDPDLTTHQAYGVPNSAVTPELWEAVQVAAVNALRGMGHAEMPAPEAYETLSRLDGYTPTDRDMADFERHRAQRTGQFLVDRDGIVRWVNIECAQRGLAGVDEMPSDEELLAAARAL
jgi:hypothetical protein